MQQNDEHIEQQLWEYIDGTCTNADRGRIAALVQNDRVWTEKYKELMVFQQHLTAANELQEPHMRFTQNIMDTIQGTQPLPVISKYINRALLRGIAAFFVVTIGILLLAVLLSTNWSAPVHTVAQIPSVHISNAFSGAFTSQSIMIALGLVVMLTLAFLDNILRTRNWKHR